MDFGPQHGSGVGVVDDIERQSRWNDKETKSSSMRTTGETLLKIVTVFPNSRLVSLKEHHHEQSARCQS
jgi:hypothetical protein